MSKGWEEAIISKIDEILYRFIMCENEDQIQNSQLYLILLYLTMRLKSQKEKDYSDHEEDMQELLREIKEFQEEHKLGLQKILREIP